MAEKAQITGGIGGALKGAATGSAFGFPGTVAGAIIGGIGGALAGSGADDARRLAEAQAELIELETQENIRRTNIARRRIVGQAKGTIGAGNLQDRYSPAAYTDSLESSFLSDIAFTHLAGRERAKAARLGGEAAAEAIEMQGYLDLLGGLSSAAGTFGPGILDRMGRDTKPAWLQKRMSGDDPYNIGWSALGG